MMAIQRKVNAFKLALNVCEIAFILYFKLTKLRY